MKSIKAWKHSFMSDVKWQDYSEKLMKIFKPIKSIWILGEVKKWKKRSVEAWVELTIWIFFWEKWKSEKTRSVEVLGVLLFVGRNYKKIFLGKLGKVKKWKKRSVEAQVLTHYLRLKIRQKISVTKTNSLIGSYLLLMMLKK